MSNVTATVNNNQTATGSAGANASDAAASQDRFLKLFVAQLKNQDPMNPMDNAQMTTQMAQINTVAGIEKLNTTITSMASQFSSMQVLQATPLVGHDVLLQSNTLSVNNGVARGAIDLESSAEKVSVQILDGAGQVVDTLSLGSQNAGRVNFEWNAAAHPGITRPTFKVTATQGKLAVNATALARDTIASIGVDSSGTLLAQLQGRQAVPYSAIKAFF
ncbi:flagellar hook capping FlgD N-terminal domain-containing protein [Curvibacter sp. APW13]|uniref:flagellar hook assembly protein FlgD n=1 Tax=Curvibacter sp. APW13 TaxID=3077236 RepID=UPI0028DF40E3|nr:flagellar hook capping FlgD N-terminal domain-containing protein [Curvibacter sp. APW13]MDT8993041.1 flagellar hook capping FlgD N-terminal domain-containing protein [Curvibacter sp. APW13]